MVNTENSKYKGPTRPQKFEKNNNGPKVAQKHHSKVFGLKGQRFQHKTQRQQMRVV